MAGEEKVLAQELEAEGWEPQFTVEAERADEYVELYEEMGLEVRVEPVTPDLMVAEECATCLLAACDRYVVIYTRSREDGHEPEV
ncbi:MAG TPA: hypothetical protein EYP55_00920 [Anaerolineae bacterium]|nr:hypothetical protein [Anaerolineae bacterium]